MGGSNFIPTKGTLLTIFLCSMLILTGGAAVAPAPSLIEQFFPEQDTPVSMIITIPSLAIALVGFVIGSPADRLGKVSVPGVALAILMAAGAFGFLISDLYILFTVCFIIGIGIAGIISTVLALIAEYYIGISRAKVLNY